MTTEKTKETILPMLNPYSYHFFEYKKEKFLFDVNTTAFSLVDDVTYRTLQLAGENTRLEVAKIIDEEFSPGSFAVVDDALDKMRCSGFFSVPPIDMRYQQEQLNNLWRHRPRRLQLFVAQACNLKCKYCYAENNESNSKLKLMSDDIAFASVDYLIRRSGSRKDLLITFFGGEPTLNFSLIEKVVAYCEKRSKEYKKNFSFELITNGTLLDKEMMDFVLDRDFLLFVSIDGWRAMNNHQRPSVTGEDYFDKIIYNAQYLVNGLRERRSNLKVKIRTNLTSDYYDVKSVANFLESFGFDYIGIGAILPLSWDVDGTTPMALSNKQLSEFESMQDEMLLQALIDKAGGKRPGAYINRLLNKSIDNCKSIRSTMGITCGIGRNTNAVDTDGNIFPCHRYVGMNNYILGNVFDGLDYRKVMGKYQAYNRNAVEMCSKCWARNICAGGCPWDISRPDGNICKRPQEECERRLRGLERGLWLYKEARKLLPNIFKDIDPKEDPYWMSRTK
jgi:uncharacterized protein